MTQSRFQLAQTLDSLQASGRVSITEHPDALVVNQLHGDEARQVLNLLAAAGMEHIRAEDEDSSLAAESIDDEDVGITIRAHKPNVPADVGAYLTQHGLAATLSRPQINRRIWVSGLDKAFETLTVRFAPWGDLTAFDPVAQPSSPRSVVRVLGDTTRFPDDLGRWLLREADTPIEGLGIQVWLRMAVEQLSQALADEIDVDGRLLFRGPPVRRFTSTAQSTVEREDLEAIMRGAKWVFENSYEIENRHLLFSAEIARTALQSGDAVDLARICGVSLEGARIAYSFGVTKQSLDSLKALSDLRKAVTDETARLSEATRGLTTAVAGAVLANIGMVIAKFSITANAKWIPEAAIITGIVLVGYVGCVIGSGAHFLKLQATIRNEWRAHLYRFLSDGDYKRMVTDPITRAENAFWSTAVLVGTLAFLLFLVSFIVMQN